MILPAVESVMCKELTDSVDMGAFQERHLSLLSKVKFDSLLRLPSDLEKVGLTVDWFVYQPRQKAFGNNVERQLIIKNASTKLSKQHWMTPFFQPRALSGTEMEANMAHFTPDLTKILPHSFGCLTLQHSSLNNICRERTRKWASLNPFGELNHWNLLPDIIVYLH